MITVYYYKKFENSGITQQTQFKPKSAKLWPWNKILESEHHILLPCIFHFFNYTKSNQNIYKKIPLIISLLTYV